MAARLQLALLPTIRISAPRRTVPNFALLGFGLRKKVESLAKTALREPQVQPKALPAITYANPANQGFGRPLAQSRARPVPPDLFPSQAGLTCVPNVQWEPTPPVARSSANPVSLEPITLQWERNSAWLVLPARHRPRVLSLKSSAHCRVKPALGQQRAERPAPFVKLALPTTRLDLWVSRVASGAPLERMLTSLECELA